MTERIRHILVVIPARNEAETLRACLASVERARHRVRHLARTSVVLVLDACTDDSAAIAAEFSQVTVLSVGFANVGSSRALGVEHGLHLVDHDPAAVWIATTDADSMAANGWLREHLSAAATGADALVGSVVPLLDDLDEARRAAWLASHSPGSTLGHVHGANLGVRAAAYRAIGGFAALTEDEDVSLVERLRATGARIAHTEREPVTTSGRLNGRVAGGYARYLTELVTQR